VAEVAGDVWHLFMPLIELIKATSQQLDGARASGASFGNVDGAALGVLVDGLTYGVRMFIGLGEAIGNAAGWVVGHELDSREQMRLPATRRTAADPTARRRCC
jgi:hypothetical protein